MADTELQAMDTRNLLDVVDKLRSRGISRYIDLPEIIVCGKQSSGKSSVLEAISGITFPSKDSLCTRFATELVLRRGPALPVKISIISSSKEICSEEEEAKLIAFKHELNASAEEIKLDDIDSAKKAMNIDDTSKVFSSHVLRLELSGPEHPHLTLVDLPGLFQAGSRTQSDADSETVKSLVQDHMKRARSIILAVVSAKNDINNQIITKYCRDIDANGDRTMGLVTKPDTLDVGSNMERLYVDLVQNKDITFRLAWHVLRNRDFNTRNSTLEERNKAEDQFFSSGVWTAVPRAQLGVRSLKTRLSKVLKNQILLQIPEVLDQIQDQIEDCSTKLEVLGRSRVTEREQRQYLLDISQSFTDLVRAAVEGTYYDPFFGIVASDDSYKKRLRASLQNQLTDFAATMRKNGHSHTIVEKISEEEPGCITRKEYITKVNEQLRMSKGRELPGMFDPLIIGQLFQDQCKPWDAIIKYTQNEIVGSSEAMLRLALAHCTDLSTFIKLMEEYLQPKFNDLERDMDKKVVELLEPYKSGHPITYNHYVTEEVQKAQAGRRTQELKKTLKKYFGAKNAGDPIIVVSLHIDDLVKNLVAKTEADMEDYASSTATDWMLAYYKVSRLMVQTTVRLSHIAQVSLKKIVDDVSTYAIEKCFIEKLPALFNAKDVLDMTDDMVARLAGEDEEITLERIQSTEKLKVLQEGLKELKSFHGVPQFLRHGKFCFGPLSCTTNSC